MVFFRYITAVVFFCESFRDDWESTIRNRFSISKSTDRITIFFCIKLTEHQQGGASTVCVFRPVKPRAVHTSVNAHPSVQLFKKKIHNNTDH